MPISDAAALHILIVEDNKMDQLLIRRELSKSDFLCAVDNTDNKQEFLEKLESFRPNLILCDFSMPQFGALDVLDTLHAREMDIPVIIVTGTLTDEMAVACLKKGAIDYILKEKIVRLPSAIKIALDLVKSKKDKIFAENLLRENEKQLQIITDVLPASLTYISPAFDFHFANKVNLYWFKKNIAGSTVSEILGEDVLEKIQSQMLVLKVGGQISFESKIANTDPVIFVSITIVPDIDTEGRVKGFVCLITDISDRKAYEEQLKEAKKEADAANQAKSQFLANMSHEIRTPLNAIMGLSELLTSPDAKPGEVSEWAEKIMRNSEHLKSVIDEVLDLSKVEAGKLQILRTRFSLSKVVSQIQSMLSPLAREKALTINFTVEGLIPESVETDIEKFRHILINILGNAIKFSSVGPIVLVAKLDKTTRPGPFLVIEITDRGPGVSDADQKNLFKPFTQIDNSMTRKFGGTGLGLSLARKFAQALGGDVKLIESTLGKGSTFRVELPTGPIEQTKMINRFETLFKKDEKPLNPGETKQKPEKSDFSVLLVEDSEDNQYLVQRFLETEGIQVEVASDGEEGLNKALGGHHDLILMDIQMPVLDGYNATSRLRKQGYDKPILAFTAHAFQAERERCLKVGFNDFLAKPIKKSDLLLLVNKYKNSKLASSAQNS